MNEIVGTLLTEEEAAQYLRLNPWTLRLWRKEGRGPRWTKVENTVRYPSQWLAEYLESRAHGPEVQPPTAA